MSWTKLADHVNLSASACQRRVESLQAAGVIEKFTIAVDSAALGMTIKAFIAVNVARSDTEQADAFRAALAAHPQVRSAHMISGAIDFMLEVQARDIEDLARFLDEELLKMPAVRDATSSIVLKSVKHPEPVF